MNTKVLHPINVLDPLYKIVTGLIITLLLSACGTSNTEENPEIVLTPSSDTQCNAESAEGDVLVFKQEFCDNLLVLSCADCHSDGGQSPTFVHTDPNIAYTEARSVINFDNVSQSLIVTKVAGGHNCWVGNDEICERTIINYIENWTGDSEDTSGGTALRSPTIKTVGATKAFPNESSGFSPVHNLLTTYCSQCHVEGQQTPFIGSSDIDVSYNASKNKIDLLSPADSRFVGRLRDESHNCWDNNCENSADEMQDAITQFSGGIEVVELNPELVASKALSLLSDGQTGNTAKRYEDDVIASYEFSSGKGNIAYDTSFITPVMDLSLSGNVEWVGGGGLRFSKGLPNDDDADNDLNGKAQATTSSSQKLHTELTKSGEYTIEAWVIPANVTQEDTRIITYSGSDTTRNFALGQTLYNYDFYQRSTTTDQNEAFSTADADERLQATLQHVAVTFKPGEGRRIYVNGEFTGDMDSEESGDGQLTEWDATFAFVIGNETNRNSTWEGTVRLAAIHKRALTEAQIQHNYSLGVGEKYFMLFNIDHAITAQNDSECQADSEHEIASHDNFIMFEVSQFDSYSYLFSDPRYYSLDEENLLDGIVLKGMQIGINGKEAAIGQVYKNLDITLDASKYVAEEGQSLSDLGTIIALEQGPIFDQFFLSFEQLDNCENVVSEAAPSAPPEPADGVAQPDIGLKTFDEINASMSVMTGVATTESNVAATYNTVKQQLPTVETIDGFLSAHQMAITQMAIQYCNALVEDNALRTTFFPGFDFNENVSTAFDAAGRNLIINPLLANLVGSTLGSQPENSDIDTELNNLMDTLTSCGGSCASDRTETIVKASCAAVLGSAVMLVQ